MKDDALDEDAFEALFNQLEEDLKNDNLSLDDDDEEISEEDLAKLERELEDALADDEELLGMLNLTTDELENISDLLDIGAEDKDDGDDDDVDDDNDDDDEEEEEGRPVKLKTWQLRRLASALKTGRRKTSVSLLIL